eukprot:gnl/TRDRNA2_/TRDRNA2_154578_c4_seq3.p1 gnl/TRDRNA2_/TRDRNA2_154578_c4~~gnl/TRDRNA2_/TRDRNA2_154578_c4_seq3.p1  ORF type:complete len:525 (+),score=160.66 gnl/TRDRNA2_/TRDRNA2_154578_c4_seq3:112-1575(+)
MSQEAIQEGIKLAKEEEEKFRKANDKRGVAAMQLSFAELTYFSRSSAERMEAIRCATEAREVLSQCGDAKLEAVALHVLVVMHLQNFEFKQAEEYAKDGVAVMKAAGEKTGEAKAWHLLAGVFDSMRNSTDAMRARKEALKLFRAHGPRKLAAFELWSIAESYSGAKRHAEAMAAAKEAYMIFEEINYGKGYAAHSLCFLVEAYTGMGNKKRAVELAKEGLAKFQERGDVRSEVVIQGGLVAALLGPTGDESIVEAMEVAEDMLANIRSLGDTLWEAETLKMISGLHFKNGDHASGEETLMEAGELFKEIGHEQCQADTLDTAVRCHVATKDFDKALSAAESKREHYRNTKQPIKEGLALLHVAQVIASRPDCDKAMLDDAMAKAKDAQRMFQDVGDKAHEAACLGTIAEFYSAMSDNPNALRSAMRARELFHFAGDKVNQAKLLRSMSYMYVNDEEAEEADEAEEEGDDDEEEGDEEDEGEEEEED